MKALQANKIKRYRSMLRKQGYKLKSISVAEYMRILETINIRPDQLRLVIEGARACTKKWENLQRHLLIYIAWNNKYELNLNWV